MDREADISDAMDRITAIIKQYPDNDEGYFANNVHRYKFTLGRFLESSNSGRILDVGCHYLHQAMLLSFLGFDVWGLDVSDFVKKESIKKRAETAKIRLCQVNNLYMLDCLDFFKDDTFDTIFFTEILEHIAFNPIPMWKEIHRVLRPRGKIIVTTPNYYYLPNRINRLKRSIKLLGGYISLEDIFANVTFGHHWKEYSVRELKRYFALLSKDFHVSKASLFNPYGYPVLSVRRTFFYILGLIFRELQKSIYVEVCLQTKESGIQLKQPKY